MRNDTDTTDLTDVDEPTEADLALIPTLFEDELTTDEFLFLEHLPGVNFPFLYPKDRGFSFSYMMGEDDEEGEALVAFECEVLS